MMTKGSRILVLVAALALGLVYVLPVWRIKLQAPQYPEGLGMVIRINTIEGVKKHDLNNINNLNHYIGMKRIEPEAIPELRIMPVLVGVLMGLGALAAAVGRRKALYAFTGLFLAFAVAGMVDFWMWTYDYGHNLDEEHAIMKIPGMSYQPPLIGSKQILNFRANSWPGAGGWILIAAGGLFTLVTASEVRRGRREGSGVGGASGDAGRSPVAPALAALALGATLAAGACSEPQPRPIAYGTDTCEHCRMSVMDERHGTEAVTKTGRTYTFDSVECLAAWFGGLDDPATVHSLWVTDFSNAPELIRAEGAHFLVSSTLQSSMGLGLTAFAREEDRDGAVLSFGGDARNWAGVRALVAEKWPEGRPQHGMGQGMHGGHSETMAPPT
ncbi:MAG TPA: nitrous oxide reductase accessory protein NosL [Longimicrobiales bacterium]|nr:nitrous oxide reductase accessory protein NosL [Longimicrobiales bacterium]